MSVKNKEGAAGRREMEEDVFVTWRLACTPNAIFKEYTFREHEGRVKTHKSFTVTQSGNSEN